MIRPNPVHLIESQYSRLSDIAISLPPMSKIALIATTPAITTPVWSSRSQRHAIIHSIFLL